jgi:hypothetical protein
MAINRELEVAEMKDGSDELAGLGYMSFRQTDGLQRRLEAIKTDSIIVMGTA